MSSGVTHVPTLSLIYELDLDSSNVMKPRKIRIRQMQIS